MWNAVALAHEESLDPRNGPYGIENDRISQQLRFPQRGINAGDGEWLRDAGKEAKCYYSEALGTEWEPA